MSRRVEFVWPDELVEAVDRARGDVSRSRFVKRALEKALDVGRTSHARGVLPPHNEADVRAASPERRPAPSRASVKPEGEWFDAAAVALERQARLNKAKK